MKIIFLILGAALVAVIGYFLLDRERFWTTFFGSADLGPVDIESMEYSGGTNTHLICPPGYCKNAKADSDAPIFAVSGAELRQGLLDQLNAAPRTTIMADDGDIRVVSRTDRMRFPDTISIRVIDIADNQASVAMFSRSQIGRSDFGVNGSRIKSIIRRLSERFDVVPSTGD